MIGVMSVVSSNFQVRGGHGTYIYIWGESSTKHFRMRIPVLVTPLLALFQNHKVILHRFLKYGTHS
jgi:hypothetical protein